MPLKPCTWPTPEINQPTALQLAPPLGELLMAVGPPPAPPWTGPVSPFVFPFNNVACLYWFATLARASYGTTSAYFTTAAQAVVNTTFPITFVANSGVVTPGYGIIKLPLGAIVVISGTTNLGQWQEQIYAGSLVPTSFGQGNTVDTSKVLSVYKSSADTIYATLNPLLGAEDGVTLVGHSMGGAVAEALSYKLTLAGRQTRCLTFAGPKTGDSSFAERQDVGETKHRRVMIANDIVPALPPNLNFLPKSVIPPAVFAAVYPQWSSYRTVGSPYYIADNGTPVPGDEPFIVLAIVNTMLAAAAGQPLPILDAHNMVSFTDRLGTTFRDGTGGFSRSWRSPTDINTVNQTMTAVGMR